MRICAAALALVIAASLIGTSLIDTSPALAQAPFYQSKQIKVLVGFSPGGGTDLYGRVMAGLVPAIPIRLARCQTIGIAGTSPAMTTQPFRKTL